jgi:hypothetical protein
MRPNRSRYQLSYRIAKEKGSAGIIAAKPHRDQ